MSNALLVVRHSQDRKLGGMGATYRPVGPTCPQDCPLLDKVCYAQRGLVKLAQYKSAQRSDSLDILAGLDLVRHEVSGDAFANDKLDIPYVRQVLGFHRQHKKVKGLLYTHRIADWNQAGFTPDCIPRNLSILASVDSQELREQAHELGWRTARTIDHPEERRAGETLCPYDLHKFRKVRPNPVTCRSCKLCFTSKRDIAFVKF